MAGKQEPADDLFTSMDAKTFAKATGPSKEAFRAALIAADAALRELPSEPVIKKREPKRRYK